MTEEELKNEYYEEYLADEFQKFKFNPKNAKTDGAVKSLFTRLLEWSFKSSGTLPRMS